MKAIGYIRSAVDNPEAVAMQRAQIEGHCAGRGFEIVQMIIDSGYSGRTVLRPGFQSLMVDWVRNPDRSMLDCLVVRDRSRISRSLPELLAFQQMAEKYGIEIIYLSELEK